MFLNNKNVNIDLKFASLLFIYFLFFSVFVFLDNSATQVVIFDRVFRSRGDEQKPKRWEVESVQLCGRI